MSERAKCSIDYRSTFSVDYWSFFKKKIVENNRFVCLFVIYLYLLSFLFIYVYLLFLVLFRRENCIAVLACVCYGMCFVLTKCDRIRVPANCLCDHLLRCELQFCIAINATKVGQLLIEHQPTHTLNKVDRYMV